jgi:uncharacterized protein YuzE
VKIQRRIEISAFRRRLTIVSGNFSSNIEMGENVCIEDPESGESIAIESAEGQRILLEAVRLLEVQLAKRSDFNDMK